MRKKLSACFLLSAALSALAGCEADIVDRGWQPMRPLGNDFATMRPPVDPQTAILPAAVEPDGPLTLRQALAMAMLHSPDLAGASWEVRIAEARAIQAGLPPNPEIGFDLESIASPRVITTVLSLGQVIFLSDKLDRQKQVAMLDRDMSGWDWEARRIGVYSDTTKAFVMLVAAQERLALAEEIVAISRKLLDTVGERVRSGKASPLEAMKAKVELSMVRADLEQARQAVLAARQRLAATWGGTAPKFAKADGRLEAGGEIPTAGQVLSLVEQNPQVARWTTEMQRRHAVVRLERRNAIPDLLIGGGYKREKAQTEAASGTDPLAEGGIAEAGSVVAKGFTIGASIEIPIFDRNQEGIKASRYNLARGREEQRATKARVLTEIADAYQAMASAHARSAILGKEVIPEAQKAFDAASAGYNEGKFPYLDVLDAQRTVFNSRVQHLVAVAEYLAAVADIEGLIGQGIGTVVETTAETTVQETATRKSQEK